MFLWGQHSSFVLFLPPTLHQLFTNSSPGTSASDDHVLDLDGLVPAFVDVQSALQAAQAERDYYANECADRMVRREVQQCMMAGQPTGAVGALRWDVVKGRVRTTPVYFDLLWSTLVYFGLLLLIFLLSSSVLFSGRVAALGGRRTGNGTVRAVRDQSKRSQDDSQRGAGGRR